MTFLAVTHKRVSKMFSAHTPEKARKRRAKHLAVQPAEGADCGVKSNLKSVPGVMTVRGCSYAGAKGVVWAPIKDMVHISHGPVGCGYYSWSGRRSYYVGSTGIDSFGVAYPDGP